MKTVILIDNIGDDVLTGEWGLSFYIEYRDRKILLDAGGISGAFAGNAEKLGIPLEEVDAAVLSHAHYDHADGMSTFFRLNDHAKLYLRESCGENCYKKPTEKSNISAYGKDFWKHMRQACPCVRDISARGTASGCFPTLRLQPG